MARLMPVSLRTPLAVLAPLLLVHVPGARAGGQTMADQLTEEFRAFDEGATTLDSQGFSAFVQAAGRAARSRVDQQRQMDLDEAITEERSLDVSVSDEFAARVDEQEGVTSLRDLAKEHWAGAAPQRSQLKVKREQPAQ